MKLEVVGSPYELDAREDQVLTFDLTAWALPGDAIDSAGTPELRRISDGGNYSAGLRGDPIIDGLLIAQEVSLLEPGERYWLILPCQANGQVFAPRLQIVCPPL